MREAAYRTAVNRGVAATIPLYGAIVAELQQRRPVMCALVLSAAAAGLAQSGLALAAGQLARGLAGGAVPRISAGSLEDPWTWTLQQSAYFGLVAALVKGLAATSLAYTETRVSRAVGHRLRLQVLSHTLRRGLPTSAPQLLASLGVRVAQVEQAVTYGAIRTVRAVAQLVPLSACLIWMSPWLASGGAVAFTLVGWGLGRFRKRWREADETAQRLTETTHAHADELISGADLWRTYGAGDQILGRVAVASESASRAEARVHATRSAMSSANEVLAAAALVAAVVWGTRATVDFGRYHLLEFAAVFFMAYRPLRDLSESRAWVTRGHNALGTLRALGGGVAVDPPRPNGHSWSLEALGLEDFGNIERGPRLTLQLEAGSLLCLVGANGSGKSTLLRALLGLDQATGNLKYGEEMLQSAAVGPAARPFAWVPQEAPLITGTVIDNVCLIGVEPARAWEALETLGHRSVLALARAGAIVGPGGRSASGGERRTIALARALATNLPILLIDEPTSELDSGAAADVRAALATLRGKRSALIVTHDPLLVSQSDRVVALGPPAAAHAAE